MVKDFFFMYLFYYNKFIMFMYICNLINRIFKKIIEKNNNIYIVYF